MAIDLRNGDHAGIHQLDISKQLAGFREADDAREQLIQNLLSNLGQLTKENRRLEDDYNNEALSRRNWQTQANDHRRELETIRHRAESDPFALVLIDGDGCVFQDALLKKAGDGGAEAAHLLYNAILDTLQERGAPIGTVMVNIYADLDSLARKLASVGLINTPVDLQAFTRSFSMNKPLFNFVDVGKGKERADHKIKEMFRLFVRNTHCKQIFFAGCHDNGYLLDLETYKRDASVASRMTLLESTDAEYQYRNLGFPIVRYESVFRSQPLPEHRFTQSTFQQPLAMLPKYPPVPETSLSPAANVFSPFSGSENVFAPPPPPPAASVAPPVGQAVKPPTPVQQNGNNAGAAAKPLRKPSSETEQSAGPSPATTWATVGGSSKSKNISIAPTKEPKPMKYSVYNADNHRIDEPLPKLDREAEANVRHRINTNGKLCNNFHLRGLCPKGSGCEFSHEPHLREAERNVLKQRARTSNCKNYGDCSDALCFSGHTCPHANCSRGSDCYFSYTHGIDMTPHLRVYEDDSVATYARPAEA